jgi:hypothetical protein
MCKPKVLCGLSIESNPEINPKTIPNSRNQGFFQNSKEKRGNEHGDKIESKTSAHTTMSM